MKLSKPQEATVLGFKILIDSRGSVVTEMCGIPPEDLHKAFKGEELETIRNIVHLTKPKLDVLHAFLEAELNALNHKG